MEQDTVTRQIETVIPPEFRGCITVREEGNIVYQKAMGYADFPNLIPNTVETKFATASAGKVFVAVGILKLIETGKLSLNSTIGDILPLDWHAIDTKITILQLLNHTSGIPDYFDESVMEEYEELWIDYPNYKIRSNKDLLPLFIVKPMMYPRGERFQYNNSGYVVLGLIMEQITGMEFDAYLKETIFIPCDMSNTGYYELDRLPAKCANTYIFDEVRNEYYTNIYSVDVKGTGAGGAYTTVLDIEKFWDNLLFGTLLSKESLNQMLNVQSVNGRSKYGFGIWLKELSDGSMLPFFQGDDPGVCLDSCYHREKNVLVTIVSNYHDDVWNIKWNILRDVFGINP